MKKDTQPPSAPRGKSAKPPSSAAKPLAEALPASAPARGRRWLMKCEPAAYTISDLQRDGTTTWEGVRNYQARNFMRDMKRGDRILFYASNAEPSGVTGIAEISREAFPDPFALKKGHAYYDPKATAEEPIWVSVELKFVEKFDDIVSLETLKSTKGLEEMVVTKKGSRLSIQPVTEEEFEIVAKLGRR